MKCARTGCFNEIAYVGLCLECQKYRFAPIDNAGLLRDIICANDLLQSIAVAEHWCDMIIMGRFPTIGPKKLLISA